MLRIVITDGDIRYERISKQKAFKHFTDGQPVYWIAHKMRPGRPFSMGLTVFPQEHIEHARDVCEIKKNVERYAFDKALHNFAFYNCTHETGYYVAFYEESSLKNSS